MLYFWLGNTRRHQTREKEIKNVIAGFKSFIDKGDVVTIAVGLVLVLFFKTIVDAILEGVILPIIPAIFGEPNFAAIGFEVGDAFISIGLVINALVSFLAVAFTLFLLFKAYNKSKGPEEEEASGPGEVDLLTEIRDQLCANN